MDFDKIPQFTIGPNDEASKSFLEANIDNFRDAVQHIWQLPYGRNSDRANFILPLVEGCATCSTKHALLAQLANEQNIEEVELILGIFMKSAQTHPAISRVLDKYELAELPEAHCVLKISGTYYDFTFPDNSNPDHDPNFIMEEKITPEQIGEYKVGFHQEYMRRWLAENNIKYSFEKLWTIREECIHALGE